MIFFAKLYFPQDRIKSLLLLLLVALVYISFLNSPLVFDDISFFKYPIIQYADKSFDFSFRWFPYTTISVTWAFLGEAPAVFRVQNLLLHAMNVLLLLLVLRMWIALFVEDAAKKNMAMWEAS